MYLIKTIVLDCAAAVFKYREKKIKYTVLFYPKNIVYQRSTPYLFVKH